MQGRSLKLLPTDSEVRRNWDSTAYIQISASMVGRALRTQAWMFSVYDPTQGGADAPTSTHYIDYAMYDVGTDPSQKTDLVGRPKFPYVQTGGEVTSDGRVNYKEIAVRMRAELKRRIVANGEPEPALQAQRFIV